MRGSDGAQNKLDENANKLCKWFVDNHMKLNDEKVISCYSEVIP